MTGTKRFVFGLWPFSPDWISSPAMNIYGPKQCPTGTRYPTRTRSFFQYPIRTRFLFKIIGYFGYRVFHLFWPDKPVTLQDIHVGQYCFLPTQHLSSLDLSSVNTAKHSIHEVIQPICGNSQIKIQLRQKIKQLYAKLKYRGIHKFTAVIVKDIVSIQIFNSIKKNKIRIQIERENRIR